MKCFANQRNVIRNVLLFFFNKRDTLHLFHTSKWFDKQSQSEKLYNILTIQSKIQCYANRITIKKDINKLKKIVYIFYRRKKRTIQRNRARIGKIRLFQGKMFYTLNETTTICHGLFAYTCYIRQQKPILDIKIDEYTYY